MLNKVMIIGNVGKEPEMRFTPSGAAVTSFSVAVNEKFTSEGDQQERTEWFNIVVWNKLAEVCNQFLDKGSKVYVEGKLKTLKWQDKDEQYHYRTEVIASQVEFLSPKPEKVEVIAVEGGLDPEDIPF